MRTIHCYLWVTFFDRCIVLTKSGYSQPNNEHQSSRLCLSNGRFVFIAVKLVTYRYFIGLMEQTWRNILYRITKKTCKLSLGIQVHILRISKLCVLLQQLQNQRVDLQGPISYIRHSNIYNRDRINCIMTHVFVTDIDINLLWDHGLLFYHHNISQYLEISSVSNACCFRVDWPIVYQ